ncbi:MAG TPA: hypothetical protein VKY27_07695 [Bacteriovoracaceae bacterium]|nr:hypothetical protein [Bacteriovoracaceae bacterium]
MAKLFFISLMTIFSLQVKAADLEIEGPRWIAKFQGYVCDNSGINVEAPGTMSAMNVVWESIVTDYTLDNGLIKATFQENGHTCRYSAVLFADNAAYTIKLVDSKAYSFEGTSCENGKRILDEALFNNEYLYYGRPHNLAIMAPFAEADALCPGSDRVGVNFRVAGRIK